MSVDPETTSGHHVGYPGVGWLLLAWSAVGLLTSARYLLQPPKPHGFAFAGTIVLASIAYFAPWAVLSQAAFRLEGLFPLGGAAWGGNLTRLLASSLPVCTVASPLMLLAQTVVLSAFGMPGHPSSGDRFWFTHVPIAAVCFWCSVAANYLIRTMHELREHERREARLALEKSQLETGLNQAQLQVLRAKLNPHFLFNSLQNVSALTRQDPETASRMLTRLGDLLRAVLRQDAAPESPLRDEIELTQAYVALEQLRFGDRLRVGFEIAPEVQAAMVPCFLLQPLIENALVHGLRSVRRDGRIVVSAARDGSDLVLRVTDDGVGLPSGDGAKLEVGVGLGSTRGRLERMYGPRHTFSIGAPSQGGTEVRITVPLNPESDAARAGDDE